MTTYSRTHIYESLAAQCLVPVFYHDDLQVCQRVLAASYDAGLRAFEFTNRGPAALAHFTALQAYAQAQLPGMALGVGTILDAATAALFVQHGAAFVVSPIFSPAIAELCNRRKLAWIPGAGSTTEVSNAEALGAEIVKVFPASTLGPSFVQAVLGPMPWSKLMPTGGLQPTEASLKPWLQAGAVAVGIGQALFGDVQQASVTDMTQAVQRTLDIIKTLRK